jgi:hypothetical protein
MAPLGAEGATARMQGMADMIALGFACDVTRVVSIMYSGSAAEHVFSEIGQNGGNHSLSHEGENAQNELDASTTKTMEHLGLLLGALSGAPEGGGNLLDQTAILASSDTSDGALHSTDDYPVLVAGGGGGYLKHPGVHVNMDRDNTTKVLLTLARAMGIEATEFGGGNGHVTESCTPIEA